MLDRMEGMRRFSAVLDAYPPGFTGNRLNLLFLDDAEPIEEPQAYLRQLDDLLLMEERREYLLDEQSPWPFPRVQLAARPDPWAVSECQQQYNSVPKTATEKCTT